MNWIAQGSANFACYLRRARSLRVGQIKAHGHNLAVGWLPSSGNVRDYRYTVECRAVLLPKEDVESGPRVYPAPESGEHAQWANHPRAHYRPLSRPEGRLDSWKEIAAYLQRDVTTVQRWEKREGMPVHRHLHDKAGSVYAYRSELDAWQKSRKLQLEELAQEQKATPQAEPVASPKRISRSQVWMFLAGVVVTLVLAVLIAMSREHARPPQIRSLAVLPLKNLSGDSAQDYLADGMTEALIARLSAIHDLRVISRTSVMRFKETKLSVPEIAKTLGVDALVEGSVIRAGHSNSCYRAIDSGSHRRSFLVGDLRP